MIETEITTKEVSNELSNGLIDELLNKFNKEFILTIRIYEYIPS